jgi:hypothetical protein
VEQKDQLLHLLRAAVVRAAMNSAEVCTIAAELAKAGSQVQVKIEVSVEPAPAFDVVAFDGEFLRSMRIEP